VLGAAYAAGLAVGFFGSAADLRAKWAVDRTWNPSLDEPERERLDGMWKKAVQRSFDWLE
jgi:glycerol kinase